MRVTSPANYLSYAEESNVGRQVDVPHLEMAMKDERCLRKPRIDN